MQHVKLPTIETLYANFDADFKAGKLYWKGRRREAGSVNARGYRKVKLFGQTYAAHRVLYAMAHGKDPEDQEVDHINGVFDDNRLANLRLADRSVNCANRRGWRNGLRGAYAVADEWMAVIHVAGKRRYLGRYSTEQAAHNAYVAAAQQAYGALARTE